MAGKLSKKLSEKVQELGIGKYQRHIFLCADQSKPECCSKEAGLESWNYLKARLSELGLTGSEPLVYRSKVNCLRLCSQGPIAVVYPDNVWYHSCTPQVLEQIIQKHLIAGQVLEAFRIPAAEQPGDI